MLEVKNISFRYGRRDILKNLSFSMKEGEFVCILGANGCGKTTLLKTILGFLRPNSGEVLLNGENMQRMKEKDLAQKVAYIPQNHVPPFPFSVMDVVLMGRTPYMNKSYSPAEKDRAIAVEALKTLGILSYASRKYTELSGGQRQMVIIARAIAQQTAILIMDEPTASLDFANQYMALEQMRSLSKQKMSILMVTHNPDHALYCADRIVAMKEGQVICEGSAQNVMRDNVLQEIYGMDIKVRDVDVVGNKRVTVCIPLPDLSKQQTVQHMAI